MQSRSLLSAALSLVCLLSAPHALAHVGDHATTGPIESFVHLLTGAGHYLAVPLLLVFALALNYLLKLRSPS